MCLAKALVGQFRQIGLLSRNAGYSPRWVVCCEGWSSTRLLGGGAHCRAQRPVRTAPFAHNLQPAALPSPLGPTWPSSCTSPPPLLEMAPMVTLASTPTLLFFLVALLAALEPVVSAHAPLSPCSKRAKVCRGVTTDIAAPPQYMISWQVDGAQTLFQGAAGFIDGYTVEKQGRVRQASLDACLLRCDATAGCEFVQLVQVDGSRGESVLCGMYKRYIASKEATHKTAPNGGRVITSYGVRNQAAAIDTTTMDGLPASPPGATLVQFQPCAVRATVPLFTSSGFNGSHASKLYIVQHGAGSNFQDYFSYLYPLLDDNSLLVSPAFYETNDGVAPTTWYQPSLNLAWPRGTGSWTAGADAIAPTAGEHALDGGHCSSFDVYDALLEHFASRDCFPHLRHVYFVGHSGGANALSRYSQLFDGRYPSFTNRFILANAANQAYFTDARPETSVCPEGREYPFQLVRSGMNRYARKHFFAALLTFQRWISRDIVTLVGNNDTAEASPGAGQNCQSQAQGGRNRRDRNYAWWAYTNILAGTRTNVSDYYGYKELLASGAKRIALARKLNHQNCIVDGVGHDAEQMFKSDCGVAALTQRHVPAGVGPLQG